MIWSRNYEEQAAAGRPRTVSFIRSAATRVADVAELRLVNIFEAKRVLAKISVAARFMLGLAKNRHLPLQQLLFSDRISASEILSALVWLKPKTVYLDGIRAAVLAPQIRATYPSVRLVIDFDDLMSRRIDLLLANRSAMVAGYLERQLWPGLKRLLAVPAINRALLRHESPALRRAEATALRVADAIVLVSQVDAAEFAMHADASLAKRIVTIPPPVLLKRFIGFDERQPRFVFVGTDALTQNRLTIDFLLDLWRRRRPSSSLTIVGRQVREYARVPASVTFTGFVKDLDQLLAGSIVLAPSFIGGGIKSKVLDAFAMGCPVVGTKETFEGLPLPRMPTAFDDLEKLEELVELPQRHVAILHDASRIGWQIAQRELSVERFLQRWGDVLRHAEADSGRRPEYDFLRANTCH